MNEIINKILTFFNSIDWGSAYTFITTNKFLWIALVIFGGFIIIKRIFRKNSLVIKSTSGNDITLSKHAVHEIVLGECAKISTVIEPTTQLKILRKNILLNVKIKIAIGSKILETSNILQKTLEHVLCAELGLGNKIKINIVVTGFLSAKYSQRLQNFYNKKYSSDKNNFTNFSDANL